jgi:membrane protein DedA with SNARE-associated domain
MGDGHIQKGGILPRDDGGNAMMPWSDIGKYLGVFFTLVVSAFGVPIPEEVPIITGGVLVGKEWNDPNSWMKWWIMLPVCIAGVVVCDLVLYVIGRKWGVKLLQRQWVQKHVLPPEKKAKIERNFHDYGIVILLVARFLPGIRSPIFIMSGVMKVPLRKFLLADGLYAIPGVNLLFWLSYWFTDQFLRAFDKVEGNRPIVVAVILAAVSGFLLYQYIIRRRVTTGDPAELPVIVQQVASSISHQLHRTHGNLPEPTLGDPPPGGGLPTEQKQVSEPPAPDKPVTDSGGG